MSELVKIYYTYLYMFSEAGDNIAEGDKIITPFTIRYEFSSGLPHHKLKIIKETSRQTKYMSERLNLFSNYLGNN